MQKIYAANTNLWQIEWTITYLIGTCCYSNVLLLVDMHKYSAYAICDGYSCRVKTARGQHLNLISKIWCWSAGKCPGLIYASFVRLVVVLMMADPWHICPTSTQVYLSVHNICKVVCKCVCCTRPVWNGEIFERAHDATLFTAAIACNTLLPSILPPPASSFKSLRKCRITYTYHDMEINYFYGHRCPR